jgi:hypothetical protein
MMRILAAGFFMGQPPTDQVVEGSSSWFERGRVLGLNRRCETGARSPIFQSGG